MSTTLFESEARSWSSLGPTTPGTTLTLTKPGVVEIKPHSESGIRAGLSQVARRLRRKGKGVLATYVGADARGNPIPTGRARCVKVYATLVDLDTTPYPVPDQYNRPDQWYYLGMSPVPPTMDFPPVDHAPMFGWAIERIVQDRVMASVTLATPRRRWTPMGGPGPIADMRYSELADLYRELGEVLRDPFYSELASELADARYEWSTKGRMPLQR